MTYFKFEANGPVKEELTEREVGILQTALLNLAAMTNAVVSGQGVMLNPPDDGKIGITLAYEENLSDEKEQEFVDLFLRKINTFFQMSNLDLTFELANAKAKSE